VLRPLPPGPLRSPRRRLRAVQVLPTLVTAGNLFAGILALSYLVDAASASGAARDAYVVKACWMIFLGMACDALDGRLARMMRVTSPFGAQMDSLADVVTFGATPALIAKTLLMTAFPALPGKVALAFVSLYALGAALRLARYNTESAAVAVGAGPHVTRTFRGLPSPAAAGTLVALVLLKHEYALHWLDWAVLLACPILGVLMISRLPYSHVMNRYVDAPGGLPFVLAAAIAVFLGVAYFEATVAGAFVLYALTGPLVGLAAALSDRFGWAWREEDDEADLPEGDVHDDGPEGASEGRRDQGQA
jgi:CDP-diacylglycerol---serine O-phosphatidyltransferase